MPTPDAPPAPSPGFDLLRIPWIGRALRWRWSRLVLQGLFLIVAALVLYDGFTGQQLAPANSATVLVWVHYRGFVILALLLAGNLFCAACPFALPRTLARRFGRPGRRFPRHLRNKWVSLAGLFLIFWLYEWLDLWASPMLTAWLVAAYFAGSFLLEAIFSESPFCKYVCPLGAFNFTYATASPLIIAARDPNVCHDCRGKECLRGSHAVSGCGTELFVPQIRSNMDCVLCLDCSRACPYDNVALVARRPLAELTAGNWPQRWDRAFLVVGLTFFALSNAFGMVPPIRAVQAWLQDHLGLNSDGVRLLVLFAVGDLALPALTLFGAAWASRRLTPRAARPSMKSLASRYIPAFVPAGFGLWLAHYGFHVAVGGLTIVPVLHAFLLDHGLAWLGASPDWSLGALLPLEWIFPLQVAAVLGGFFVGLAVLARSALRTGLPPAQALRQLLPWALALTLVTLAALSIFNLPMDMRGTVRGSG